MKITKYELIVTIILVVIFFFFIKGIISNYKKLKEIKNLYETSQDSTLVYRNKLGQQVAHSSVLETSNQKYLLQLKTNDALILELQQLLKQETKKRHDIEVAIIVKSKIISHLEDSLTNVITGQTIEHKGDSTFIYPIYKHVVKDDWTYEMIQIGKSYFWRDLTVRNDYNIVIGSEPAGLFKRKQFAEITNLNPNAETGAMKVYQKKEAKSDFFPLVIGGLTGSLIMFLIKSL